MNGAESLVHTLLKGGVDVCFTNPGTSEMHFVAALDKIEGIIRESVKPMENIDSIKIVQVEGLNGAGGASVAGVGGEGGNGGGGGNLSDQVVTSALRYRAQAPLVDQLLSEVGLSGADLNGLAGALRTTPAAAAEPAKPAKKPKAAPAPEPEGDAEPG